MKRIILGLAVAVIVVWGGRSLFAAYEVRLLQAPESWPEKGAALFQIKQGQGAGAVASALEDKGLIRSSWAFRRLLGRKGWDSRLKPGMYRIEENSDSEKIGRKLVEEGAWRIRVSIPEGLTIAQIADRIEKAGAEDDGRFLPTAEQFVRAATAAQVKKATGHKVPGKSAEGYLYPATYQLPAGSSAEEIVARLTEQFAKSFSSAYRDEIAKNKLSLHELVTLASVVEREAASDKERPRVAQVFLNRLEKGMKLESCATVQYALPRHKARLLYADLKIDSPYNTYIHRGLPPGPICSPGKASLLAALRPEKTEALYFVSKGDGTHVFSRTFAEHQRAISRIRGAGN